jgi:hypothetical protein
MKHNVELNQYLKTQPGINHNRDGPEIKLIRAGKTDLK